MSVCDSPFARFPLLTQAGRMNAISESDVSKCKGEEPMMHLKLDSSFPTVSFLSPAYLPQFLCLARRKGGWILYMRRLQHNRLLLNGICLEQSDKLQLGCWRYSRQIILRWRYGKF